MQGVFYKLEQDVNTVIIVESKQSLHSLYSRRVIHSYINSVHLTGYVLEPI